MSPQIQNELLDVIGRHIILRGLLEEIKSACFFSVLTDKVTATNVELFAISLRFVDHKRDIREEFLTFQDLQRITGWHITTYVIINFIEDNGLQVANARSQRYDGASNMSSSCVGVQTRIQVCI